MPLDGITAKCLAEELNSKLQDARLDKIFQPDRFDLILHFRKDGENHRLILSANPSSPRIHLTKESRSNPSRPPMFCMLLRKHLVGARVKSITTPGYERVFKIQLTTTNELGDALDKVLVAEIMGRHSNIILLNADGRIHDAISHVDQSLSRVREVMPARQYIEPPQQDKLSPDKALDLLTSNRTILSGTSASKPLEKALLNCLQGFSPLLCQAVVVRSGLDARLKPGVMKPDEFLALNRALKMTLEDIIRQHFSPTVYYTAPGQQIPAEFHAMTLPVFARQSQVESVSDAMDLYYIERNRHNILRQKKQTLEKAVDRELVHTRKKLVIHEKDQVEGDKADRYKHFGELILANMTRDQQNLDQIKVIDYYDENQRELLIPLKPELSLSRNAQRYFKLYNKAKTREENGRRFAVQDRQDIAWLESVATSLAAAQSLDDLTAVRQEISSAGLIKERGLKRDNASQKQPHADLINPGLAGSRQRRMRRLAAVDKSRKQKAQTRPQPLQPRKYQSSDGFEILVGRNNLQNDQLTLKTAQKDDIWLHVQKIPGTHVIIRSEHRDVPGTTIEQAAQIAAWFSKAAISASKSASLSAKVPVDYCPVSHVKKPAGARPGMVIYDHYQTVMAVPEDPDVPV